MIARVLLLLAALALAAGCATKPRFETAGVETAVTPRQASAAKTTGQRVLWGGVIVNSTNLADSTQIEVLAYPLDGEQRPDVDGTPSGRFIAVRPGYLETADYAPGRLITVSGTLQEALRGRIGQADYTYPVVRADDMQLWQRRTSYDRGRTRFGIGVGIGSGGGGFGVGIGVHP